jgi:hypothetical protein
MLMPFFSLGQGAWDELPRSHGCHCSFRASSMRAGVLRHGAREVSDAACEWCKWGSGVRVGGGRRGPGGAGGRRLVNDATDEPMQRDAGRWEEAHAARGRLLTWAHG